MNLTLGQRSDNVRFKFAYIRLIRFNVGSLVSIGWFGLGLPFSFPGFYNLPSDISFVKCFGIRFYVRHKI